MIKHKKKNKLITFLCACFITCATALGFVGSIGSTLAYTPTLPTITTDYFNYNSSNYLDLFDGVFEGLTPYTFGNYVENQHFFPSASDCNFRILSGGYSFDFYSSNHRVYYIDNNNIYSNYAYYTYDNIDYYGFIMGNGFSNTPLFPSNSSYNLLDIKQELFIIVIYGLDGNYRIYCSKSAYDLNQQYLNGYNNGLQSTDAYQSGFNDGKNDVINNPNNYNLFTNQQYIDNYDDGYIKGKIDASLGIFANCEIYAVFLAIVDENNYFGQRFYTDDFNFNNGIITPKQNVINSYNEFINYVNANNIEDYTCRLSIDNLNFVYNEDIDINFLNLDTISSTEPVGVLVHVNNSVNYSNYIYRKYIPVLDNGNFVGVNISKFDYLSYLPDNLITSLDIDFNYTMPLNLPIEFYTNNRVNFNNLKIYSTSTQFNDGYNLGFIEGVDSVDTHQYYNNGYNLGVVDGFNSGYSQGLANQDNASFASMISAVIDVPINAMRNLFNFELLGVNLFGFFTALFTLLVVITIIRLILGGK